MKKISILVFVFLIVTEIKAQDFTRFVNPMIGTGGNGHVFPGATVPFGMVQLSPDQRTTGWSFCSGYHYDENIILGFSHTHLSGTGVGDLGDILLMPYIGKKPDTTQYPGKTQFSHSQEKASAGLYEVFLPKPQINVRLSASQHVGIHEYTFPKTAEAFINIDLKHKIYSDWGKQVESEFVIENDSTISGYTYITRGWAPSRRVYYVIKTSKPFKKSYLTTDLGSDVKLGLLKPGIQRLRNDNLMLNLQFSTNDKEQIKVKVAISAVSLANAKNNALEIIGWDIDEVHKAAKKLWNSYLSRLQIDAEPKVKEIFYTALYHTLIQPNQLADADSSFFGPDYKIHKSKTGNYYSTFSLWDTYRAAHPLYTLLVPEKVPDFINTITTHFNYNGYLPIWALWGTENHCMIANHAVPVVTDAIIKGFVKGKDVEEAYKAIKTSLTEDHRGSHWNGWEYVKYGYMRSDSTGGSSVSKTLECAYNDWCAAQVAKKLGKHQDYSYFMNRAQFYKNLFKPDMEMMWPKKTDGNWAVWNEYQTDYAGPYTEGNSWQYIWSVQHDPYGLIKLFKNHNACVLKLDSTFSNTHPITGPVNDVTGIIGQYAHGNEPGHHTAYFYGFLGQPWKTQHRVRQILSTLYDNQPNGLSGNEDCGQMSAWYALSALGFYPYNPANGVYILGSPAVNKAVLQVDNGKTFTIIAQNNSPQNIYVAAVKLNGKPYLNTYIRHSDIQNGGMLTFIMTNKPLKKQTLTANLPPLN